MQCRICGSTGEHRTYVAKEMMLGLRDEHAYFQCVDCNCLQITTIPDDLARYYPENYYSYRDTASADNALKQTLIKQRNYYAATGQGLLGRLLQFLSPNAKLATLRPTGITPQSTILDVGCGAGHLLHSLRDVGFQHLLGIDPFNRETIQYDNGLRIEKRDIFSATGAWDLVMFHHSFEHLPDQQAHLKRAFELVKPGGMALVRVPTVSSWAWQEYGVNWAQLDAPRHLYLHSLVSMHQLATQTGFNLEQVVYDSNGFQFWGSQQYEHDIALREPRSWAENPAQSLFSAKQIQEFEQRARELNTLNQGDQAAFYLRKPA
jgi:2-polyprenyl-3-methyl-5-hydroxy-6-metoxy-1,4-benzoquinol methylase